MNLKRTLLPLTATLAIGGLAVVAFHPGVAYAAPRMASAPKTPFAEAATYTIDPMHTSISFEIMHMGLTTVHGRINKFSGKIVEDPSDLGKSSVEFSAEIASIDTAVPPRDQHIQAPEYFDAKAFPTLSFKSTKLTRAGDNYMVTGDLTIKGKTKSITIPFTHHGPVEMKEMGPARIGIVASPFRIKRTDFGIGKADKLPDGTMPLADEVTMRLSIEAAKDK